MQVLIYFNARRAKKNPENRGFFEIFSFLFIQQLHIFLCAVREAQFIAADNDFDRRPVVEFYFSLNGYKCNLHFCHAQHGFPFFCTPV